MNYHYYTMENKKTPPHRTGRPSLYGEEMKPIFVKTPKSFYDWMYREYPGVPMAHSMRTLAMEAAKDKGYDG